MADFALTMGVAYGGAGPGSVSHGALAVGVELLERDETFAVLDGLVAEVRGDGICEAVARLRQGSASGTKGARAPLQCDRAFDSPRLIGTVVALRSLRQPSSRHHWLAETIANALFPSTRMRSCGRWCGRHDRFVGGVGGDGLAVH